MPAGQAVHEAAAAPENLLAVQVVHELAAVCAVLTLYFPAGQARHEVIPSASDVVLYVPAGHATQAPFSK